MAEMDLFVTSTAHLKTATLLTANMVHMTTATLPVFVQLLLTDTVLLKVVNLSALFRMLATDMFLPTTDCLSPTHLMLVTDILLIIVMDTTIMRPGSHFMVPQTLAVSTIYFATVLLSAMAANTEAALKWETSASIAAVVMMETP